ncbi:MAG: methyltransferase domain-containing protein [Candidatus Methylomirabilales bacterium]
MERPRLSLDARHDIERRFHDAKAVRRSGAGHGDFYAAGGLDPVWQAFLARCGDLAGKTVLDFGCGEGWTTLAYAGRGARVHAFDISPEAVRRLAEAAAARGLGDRIQARVMPAERLDYPDGMFDLVCGVSILHHTDLALTGPEIRRVLRPGGRALFIEPLDHNWLLRAFRALTPGRRTPTEKPLTVQQIFGLGRYFGRVRYEGHCLLSIFPQGLLYLTGSAGLFRRSLAVTRRLDAWLLARVPALQRYCWSSIIEVAP